MYQPGVGDLVLKTRRLADSESTDIVKFAIHSVDLVSNLLPDSQLSYKMRDPLIIDGVIDIDDVQGDYPLGEAATQSTNPADIFAEADLPATVGFRPYDWLDTDLMAPQPAAFVRSATSP